MVSLYDAIAPQWIDALQGLAAVVSFLADAARASLGGVPLVADVGCGNGRYMWCRRGRQWSKYSHLGVSLAVTRLSSRAHLPGKGFEAQSPTRFPCHTDLGRLMPCCRLPCCTTCPHAAVESVHSLN